MNYYNIIVTYKIKLIVKDIYIITTFNINTILNYNKI